MLKFSKILTDMEEKDQSVKELENRLSKKENKNREKLEKANQDYLRSIKIAKEGAKMESSKLAKEIQNKANEFIKEAEEKIDSLEKEKEELSEKLKGAEKANEELKKKFENSENTITTVINVIESCSKLIKTMASVNMELAREEIKPAVSRLGKALFPFSCSHSLCSLSFPCPSHFTLSLFFLSLCS